MKILQFAMGVIGFLAVMAVNFAYGVSTYSAAAIFALMVVLIINILHSPKWSESTVNMTKLVQVVCALIGLILMLIDTLTLRHSLVHFIALAALLVYVVAEGVMRAGKK